MLGKFTLLKQKIFCAKQKVCNHCGDRLRAIRHRLFEILFVEQSTTTRFIFGACTAFYGLFFFTSGVQEMPYLEFKFMSFLAPLWMWGAAFIVNGISLMYGAYTNKYSNIQLYLEGILGVIIWVGSAYAVIVAQKTVTASMVAAFTAFWIYIRYPTHWDNGGGEQKGGD